MVLTEGPWSWIRLSLLIWALILQFVELERALTGSILTCSIQHSLDGSVHSQNTVKKGELLSMSLRAEYLHKSLGIHFHMKFFTLHLLIHLFMSLVAYGYLLYTAGYKLIAL